MNYYVVSANLANRNHWRMFSVAAFIASTDAWNWAVAHTDDVTPYFVTDAIGAIVWAASEITAGRISEVTR